MIMFVIISSGKGLDYTTKPYRKPGFIFYVLFAPPPLVPSWQRQKEEIMQQLKQEQCGIGFALRGKEI